jgi:hypothetical protein
MHDMCIIVFIEVDTRESKAKTPEVFCTGSKEDQKEMTMEME